HVTPNSDQPFLRLVKTYQGLTIPPVAIVRIERKYPVPRGQACGTISPKQGCRRQNPMAKRFMRIELDGFLPEIKRALQGLLRLVLVVDRIDPRDAIARAESSVRTRESAIKFDGTFEQPSGLVELLDRFSG